MSWDEKKWSSDYEKEKEEELIKGKKDERIKCSEQVLDTINKHIQNGNYGIFALTKDTRVGATTSIISVSLNRLLNIIAIEPILRIAKETVGIGGIKFSDKPNTPMNYIHSNKKCSIIKSMEIETPELKHIPIILLPKNCFNCGSYESCEYANVLRAENPPIAAISHKKLIYMNAGSANIGSVAEALREIALSFDIILFDEIHEIQLFPPITFPILEYNKATGVRVPYDFDKYYNQINDLKTNYPSLYLILERSRKIINSSEVAQGIDKLIERACTNEYWSKHNSIQLINPFIDKSDVCEKKSFELIIGFFNDIVDIVINKDYGDLVIKADFGDENDLVKLYHLLPIALSQTMAISLTVSFDNVSINLSAPDSIAMIMIKDFISEAYMRRKTIIFTSATMCSLEKGEQTQYWLPQEANIIYVPFGSDGSPLKLNNQMLVLADTFSLSSKGFSSTSNLQDKIVSEIIAILSIYGVENCKVIAMNKKIANKVKRELTKHGVTSRIKKTDKPGCLEITWYKADDTMGVSSDRRIIISIGLSHKPSSSFDSLTTNFEASRKKLHERNHIDFWQAISRGKDVEGKIPSVVFALGVSHRDFVNATIWGSNRRVEIHPIVNGQAEDVEVTCDQYILGPKVVKCKNFNLMILEAMLHKPPLHAKNAISYFFNGSQYGFEASMLSFVLKTPINYNIGGQRPETQHRISLEQFLHMISTDKKPGNCSKNVLNQHRQNKTNLKTYTITTDGKAKWIRFGKLSEDDKDRLTSYFNLIGMPFKIEKVLYRKNHEEYYVWVFLVPVQAKKAKNFAKYTLKLLDMECEILPNLIAANTRTQHEIKMPFGKESSMLVDGTYA